MKKIIVLMLVFGVFSPMFSQEIGFDSSYTVNQSGTFFKVSILKYANGEESTNKVIIGDTSKISVQYQTDIDSKSAAFAALAVSVQEQKRFAELMRLLVDADAILGATFSRSLNDINSRPLLVSGWKLGVDDAVFTFNKNTGVTRVSIAGAASKKVDVFSDCIRINGFPTASTNTILYKVSGKKWVDLSRTYTLLNPSKSLR